MSWARALTRDDLLENIEVYRNESEFVTWRDTYLEHAVQSKDLTLVKALLDADAGPDIIKPWGDSLQHYLVHEYQVSRSTQGDTILAILELLLVKGANPEQVGSWRSIEIFRNWSHSLSDMARTRHRGN
jgi:hypothetical protein